MVLRFVLRNFEWAYRKSSLQSGMTNLTARVSISMISFPKITLRSNTEPYLVLMLELRLVPPQVVEFAGTIQRCAICAAEEPKIPAGVDPW